MRRLLSVTHVLNNRRSRSYYLCKISAVKIKSNYYCESTMPSFLCKWSQRSGKNFQKIGSKFAYKFFLYFSAGPGFYSGGRQTMSEPCSGVEGGGVTKYYYIWSISALNFSISKKKRNSYVKPIRPTLKNCPKLTAQDSMQKSEAWPWKSNCSVKQWKNSKYGIIN